MDRLYEFCKNELRESDYIKIKDCYAKKYIFSGTVAEYLPLMHLRGFFVLQYEDLGDYIELLVV